METLLTDVHDPVLLVRLNRPQRRNAITMQMLEELQDLLRKAGNDPAIRALVFTGDDKAFCSGQDLKEPEPPHFEDMINAVFNELEAFPKPTIAAMDGWCLAGGLELALACDVRVCSNRARIGDRHANIESIGGAGATVRLVRLLGPARAKDLVFSGAVLASEEARAIGLVDAVHDPSELIDKAIERARGYCVATARTVRFAKQSMNAAADLALDAALAFSRLCQAHVRAPLSNGPAAGAGPDETKMTS